MKPSRHIKKIAPSRSAWFVALSLATLFPTAYSRDYFNPELLEIDHPEMRNADLSAYEEDVQAPGIYHVDIVINDQLVDIRDIEFRKVEGANGKDSIEPCIPVNLLQSYGVKTALFPALGKGNECAKLSAIPEATSDFLFNTQRLILSIPQAVIENRVRGYVDPKLWDEGINALMLNYSLSGANNMSRNGGDDSNNQYANLRPGLNIGPWRVRNYTTWNRNDDGQTSWDTVYTYLQRDIVPLKSQMTLGDSSSPADVFDSVPFRGGQLASDDEMLPDSLRGYAPSVRGIARTNAQVVIRQNGYIIYQNYVPAGAFSIDDMYPTGGAGDLHVTVKEADGSEQNFIVPFASLPVLQREGHLKYSLTGGQYRSYDGNVEKTPFAQATGIYGLANNFTVYGGLQESSKYQSLALGLGKNMGDFGAFSTDVTQAWSTPNDLDKTSGQSWRIRYNKNFQDSGTDLAIAGYRYSTSGYYDLQEVMDSYGNDNALLERRRNRAELTLTQNIGSDLGSLSASAAREDYWNSGKTMESYSLGYNNSWRGISYSLNYTYSKNGSSGEYHNKTDYDKDQIIALNISVPLDRFLSNTWANYSMNASKNNGTTHTVGLSGMTLENNALSWNVQQGYGTNDVGYSGSMNADYKGTYAEMTAGYSYDENSERVNYGLEGSILAHEDGITLAQPMGETNVLIKAPGAADVSILNQTGAKTDFRGYTVVNNVSLYRKNDVSLDTSSLPDNVDLELTSQTVVPTRGAIVRANYVANVGDRALVTLMQPSGKPVPFGAIVNIEGKPGQNYIVSEAGQVYLTGLETNGTLKVHWGDKAGNSCSASYQLQENSSFPGIKVANAVCH